MRKASKKLQLTYYTARRVTLDEMLHKLAIELDGLNKEGFIDEIQEELRNTLAVERKLRKEIYGDSKKYE